MKILFVSNYYPPHEVGGYEQLCHDVAKLLFERGHEVEVVTSDRGISPGTAETETHVHRLLKIHPNYTSRLPPAAQFILTLRSTETYDRRTVRALVSALRPDLVMIWNLQGLPFSVAVDAEQMPGVATAYWLAGYTPTEPDAVEDYWRLVPTNPLLRPFKRLIGGLALRILRAERGTVRPQMRHAAVVSDYMRRRYIASGLLPSQTRVIYNGVETTNFFRPIRPRPSERLRLLVAGRVSPDKGVHSVLEALTELRTLGAPAFVTAAIVGSGPPEYRAQLDRTIADRQLADQVCFTGWLPREQMPAVMAEADVLLLPSIYPEALPRVVLEGMASGLAVIATTAGGTPEIVQDEVTGLLFAPEDSLHLARQIRRLATDDELRQRLATQGQQLVLRNFSLDRMVNEIVELMSQAQTDQGFGT